MLSTVRYSQIVGLVAIDSATARHLGEIQEVWVNDAGRIEYLSCAQGFIPLLQVAGVSTQAVSTFGHLSDKPTDPLRRLHRLPIQSTLQEANGWVEDFVFDWQTGEIAAYVLSGDIAEPSGQVKLQRFTAHETEMTPRRAVIAADDVKTISVDAVVLEPGAPDRFRSEDEGLKGFLSEKSHAVRQLVHELSDRLHDVVSPHDEPETVRVKIKTVGEEMAASGHADHSALQEAVDFLHDQWDSLQQQIRQASHRTQSALNAAWKELTGHKSA
ncbi:MAG: photosystem reaction center subunit H [Cyanobacteria bacterium J06628_6]